jgi:tRNA-modifying protein YgfZ
MITLPHLRAIRFSGVDAERFLQAQLSSNLNDLKPQQAQFAAWCAVNGRVLALGSLVRNEDGFIWFLAADSAQLATQGLNKFKLRSKVIIEVLDDVVCGLFERSPDDLSQHIYGRRAVSLAPPSEQLERDASEVTRWLRADIREMLPWNGAGERFLPQMLALEQHAGLSLKKGCFPGQEIISRLHYKGELKRSLRVLHSSIALLTGSYALESGNEHIDVLQSVETLCLAVVPKALPEQFAVHGEVGTVLCQPAG